MQQAQPILLAHHLLAYIEMLVRDRERMQDTLKRINIMPLGSAALAGTGFPIDRKYTAKLLHFSEDIKQQYRCRERPRFLPLSFVPP